MAENGKYVTYQWLIGAILSTLIITGTFSTIIITYVGGRIDSVAQQKIDRDLFMTKVTALEKLYDLQTKMLCDDVIEIKNKMESLDKLIRNTHEGRAGKDK